MTQHSAQEMAREAMADSERRRIEVNRIANLLLDTWKRVDPNSGVAKHSASYVATFADMARAIVDDRLASPPSSDGLREALQAMVDRFGHVACMQVGQAKLALSTNPSSDADALREALARIVKGARLSSAFGSEFRAGDGRLDHIDLDAADAILALIECSGALYEAASGIADDYMTSEHHHPGYVLIPTAKFEAIRAALQPDTERG